MGEQRIVAPNVHAVLHGVMSWCLGTCACLLLVSAISSPFLSGIPFLSCFAAGIAATAFALSIPGLAHVFVGFERDHPLAFGFCFGSAMIASLLVLRGATALLAICILAVIAGALSWMIVVAVFFLSDVLSIRHSMHVHSASAAFSLATSFALATVGQVVYPFAILAFMGVVLLCVELAEAKGVVADESKPLVNIFARFNKKAPLANALYGVVFGMTISFSLVYETSGFLATAMLVVGTVLAGVLPRRDNDRLVNCIVAILVAGCLLCIAVGFTPMTSIANGALLGLLGFYFLRNLGWAFGQCVKIGNMDTPVVSRALLPLLSGLFLGSLIALGLAFCGDPALVVYADAAVVFILFVSAVFFIPSLATPFAQNDAKRASSEDAWLDVPIDDSDELLKRRCDIVQEEHGLTRREAEILFLLCKGRTAEYIGKQLFISRNTARVHIYHVYNKMDIHSQQKLIDYVSSIEIAESDCSQRAGW